MCYSLDVPLLLLLRCFLADPCRARVAVWFRVCVCHVLCAAAVAASIAQACAWSVRNATRRCVGTPATPDRYPGHPISSSKSSFSCALCTLKENVGFPFREVLRVESRCHSHGRIPPSIPVPCHTIRSGSFHSLKKESSDVVKLSEGKIDEAHLDLGQPRNPRVV